MPNLCSHQTPNMNMPQASKTTKLGARAARIVRVLRLVRLVKLYKNIYEVQAQGQAMNIYTSCRSNGKKIDAILDCFEQL
eukprot:3939509-Amphidinium_carterae.1